MSIRDYIEYLDVTGIYRLSYEQVIQAYELLEQGYTYSDLKMCIRCTSIVLDECEGCAHKHVAYTNLPGRFVEE